MRYTWHMQKLTTFLMFDGNAEAAIAFYRTLFPNSRIISITKYGPNELGKEGTVQMASFVIGDQEYIAIDSPIKHEFTFTPSISLYVRCETVDEVSMLFTKLSEGGEVLMPLDTYPFSEKFGWVNDRFGVSWQLDFKK